MLLSKALWALLPLVCALAQDYHLGPLSFRQPVPHGKLTKHSWTSKMYPGSTRDYWVYVPAQYKPERAAAVMVFQDGAAFVAEDGAWRVPIVFDNLIQRGEMPVTIGIFIEAGVLPARIPGGQPRVNRRHEYDSVTDWYARFLLEEILPEVGKSYNLTADPNLRAIAGSSSGAICAFTVAWQRPDAFRRVFSAIGSYTNLRGGQIYPSLIRKTEPKPLRIFLQDGSNDLDIFAGDWFLSNQDMLSALRFAGYDVAHAWGSEAHNSVHGGSILPDVLRWLWREPEQPIVTSKGGRGERQYSVLLSDPARGWEPVSAGHKFTEGPAVDKAGNVFFSDIPNNRIHRLGLDGKLSVFKEDTGEANGLMFAPDGRLYACQDGRKRIVAYAPDGQETVLAEDVNSNDIAVTRRGEVYFTDPLHKRVWLIDAQRNKRVVHEGIAFPNGVRLSPDEAFLVVADSASRWVRSFQVQPDGSLAGDEPFYRLETMDESSQTNADGMAFDSEGWLYVTSNIGIQVFDTQGRLAAILDKPQPGSLSNLVFGGPNRDLLYATAGDKVFRRPMRRKGPPSPQQRPVQTPPAQGVSGTIHSSLHLVETGAH